MAGQLFDAAVLASGSSTITSASVKQGLCALKGYTLSGLSQPLSYTEGKTPMFNCWFSMAVLNQEFTLPDGLATQCARSEERRVGKECLE